MHEYTQKYTAHVQGSSDRSFGLVFAAVFLIIGMYPLWHGGGIRTWALAIGSGFFILSLLMSAVLSPLNRLWTKFGLMLHGVISPIVLGIIFFLAVTPTGLIMRFLGKDTLRLKFDRSLGSYWITRAPPGPDGDSLNNQF